MALSPEQKLAKLKAFQKSLQDNEIKGADKLKTAAKDSAALLKETKDEPD